MKIAKQKVNRHPTVKQTGPRLPILSATKPDVNMKKKLTAPSAVGMLLICGTE